MVVNKDLLYFITKDIKDLYMKLSLNYIHAQDNTNSIDKLKELILIEKDFYDSLTFDETINFLEKFKNYKDDDIVGRILNRLNDLLDDKYFDKGYKDDLVSDDGLLGEIMRCLFNSGTFKKTFICQKYIIRDIRLLSIYMLLELEKDGYISEEHYVGKKFLKFSRLSQTYIFSYFYCELEKELIDNDFNLTNFNLVSNLSYQLQQLPQVCYIFAKNDVLNDEIENVVEEFRRLDNYSLADESGITRILNMISVMKALVIIDESVIDILICKLVFNGKNNEIHNIVIENLKNVNKDRKNIKYLSLKKDDNYI